MKVNDLELAWAAGLFDGEGSFTLHTAHQGSVYPIASMHQVDRYVLDRFRDAVDTGKVYGPYAPHGLGNKPMYEWLSHGESKFRKVFLSLRPWLSPIKVAQAELVLEKYSNNTDNRRTSVPKDKIPEILMMLDYGYRSIDIARKLEISHKLVYYYKAKYRSNLVKGNTIRLATESV